MKILVLADLHLDEITDRDLLHRLGEEIAHVGQEADALIVAGDLAENAAHKWPGAIRWLGAHYPLAKTVLLPGNHDYYGGNLDTLDNDLNKICREAGCSFGQCRRMELGDTRILMATLWTDMRLFDAEGEAAVEDSLWNARMMPDYGYGAILIGDPERGLEPEDTIAVHERQKSWLISELAKPWSGKTVVITHHAPSAAVTGAMTPLSPCFASDLDDLIDRYRPDAWIFGHTHRPAELRMPGGSLLRNVSLGYEHELRSADIGDRVRRGLIDLKSVSGQENGD
ncbi:metallophosphoesterase [Paracoccus sp. IB05]|uniref:metallophosphoesterase n=1 Tax=Paracoccus sp. IB05 TaxID=2779367 RepID=UPI0018E8A857|nr:metallophosphoesterase [Paracoccus sp. IB05]MBJ2152679.1 metallophosphoesterase [Paracoccus sp. IB05]